MLAIMTWSYTFFAKWDNIVTFLLHAVLETIIPIIMLFVLTVFFL